MPLVGHADDLSLVDLLQLQGIARSTCRIGVTTPAGDGVLFLEGGELVHAVFAGLAGVDAARALVIEHDVHYRVENRVRAPERSMRLGVQELLMDAMRRRDEGTLLRVARPPRPRVSAPALPKPPQDARPLLVPAVVPEPQRFTPQPAQPRRRASVVARMALAAVVILGVLAGALLARTFRRSSEAGREDGRGVVSGRPPAPAAVAVETLGDASDAKPRLVDGEPASSPDPGLALQPTIVCRLLVDESGNVAAAQIYQSRLDLALFETAALEAVRGYRFSPGLENDRPVPVWINWPVSFQ